MIEIKNRKFDIGRSIKKGKKKKAEVNQKAMMWECFEVIYDSCRYWMQEDGPEGYLKYISNFLIPDGGFFDDEMMEDLEDEFDDIAEYQDINDANEI